jgi:glycosyltransferase involved in cell wall biosynthesis
MPVSRRSASLAERLGFELALLGRSGFRRPWSAPLAYPVLIARTVARLVRRRPRAIVIVAPPFLAPLVVLPVARLLRAQVAIDIHSGALLDRRWRWSIGLLAWACRRAAVSIVTLPTLASAIEARGARVVVVPDPLPRLEATGVDALSAAEVPEVVAICGWAADEPLEALAAAAAGRSWRLAITGRPRQVLALPSNAILTGFLGEAAYAERLTRAAAVVVLTTREDTLLSGAWEAIALGRPLVTSATAALRTTFGEGPVYVEPTAASIGAGIDAVLADPASAAASTEALRARFERENDAALGTVRAALVTTPGAPRGGRRGGRRRGHEASGGR